MSIVSGSDPFFPEKNLQFNPQKMDLLQSYDFFLLGTVPELLPPPSSGMKTDEPIKKIPGEIDASKFSQENAHNKSIFQRIQGLFASLFKFAKSHPLLTAGFVIGISMIVVSFPIFGASALGISSITLLGLQLPISSLLGIACLYNGITLINMARRGALKDEMELQMNTHIENLKKMQTDVKGELKHRAIEISDKESVSIKEKMSELQDLKSILEKNINGLERALSSKLDNNQKEKIRLLINNIQKNIQEGVEEAVKSNNPLVPAASHPLEEGVHGESGIFITGKSSLFNTSIALSIPSEQVTTVRQRILNDVKSRLNALGEKLKRYVTTHPASATIIALGSIVTLATLPIAFIWLGGFTSIFFIGAMSASILFNLLTYGVSLAYEGYNTMNIDKLQKELNELEKKESLNRQEILARLTGEQIIQPIQPEANAKDTDLLKKKINDDLQKRKELVRECTNLYQQIVESLLPPLDAPDLSANFDSPFEGVEILNATSKL